jgi:hypothetical protein
LPLTVRSQPAVRPQLTAPPPPTSIRAVCHEDVDDAWWGLSGERALKTDVLPVFEAGFVAAGAPPPQGRALATFYLGAFRGLLLDLLSTHDQARIEAAVEVAVQDLAQRFRRSRPHRKNRRK